MIIPSVVSKGIFREKADLLDLKVFVLNPSDNTLHPELLESGTAILMRGPSENKQVLQRIEFSREFGNSDGSFRIFFLHPNSLDNLFYQVDVELSGGLDYSKIGEFVRISKSPDLINDQTNIGLPNAPVNRDPIGDPLDPFTNSKTSQNINNGVVSAPPFILPSFLTLIDGSYQVKYQLGYKPKDVFVRGHERRDHEHGHDSEIPRTIVQIQPASSGGKVYDLITLVSVVAPGQTIPPYGVVSINSNRQAVPAIDSDNSLIKGTVGISTSNRSIGAGQSIRILLVGRTKVYNGGVPLQIGSMAWVGGILGAATTTPTTTPGKSALKLGASVGVDEIVLSIADVKAL